MLRRTNAELARTNYENRKIQKNQEKSKRDWFARVASVIALIVAAGTSYFVNFRIVDDVRVMLRYYFDDIVLRYDEPTATLAIRASHGATFINLGNRPAAITGVRLAVSGPKKQPPRNCDDRMLYYYEGEPFILAPGQVVYRSLSLASKQPPLANPEFQITYKDGFVFSPVPQGDNDDGTSFLTCIEIDVVTPDGLSDATSIPLVSDTFNEKGRSFRTPVGPEHNKTFRLNIGRSVGDEYDR